MLIPHFPQVSFIVYDTLQPQLYASDLLNFKLNVLFQLFNIHLDIIDGFFSFWGDNPGSVILRVISGLLWFFVEIVPVVIAIFIPVIIPIVISAIVAAVIHGVVIPVEVGPLAVPFLIHVPFGLVSAADIGMVAAVVVVIVLRVVIAVVIAPVMMVGIPTTVLILIHLVSSVLLIDLIEISPDEIAFLVPSDVSTSRHPSLSTSRAFAGMALPPWYMMIS